MTTDERDILELLKEELDFIEKGGYGRSVRTPWQSKSTFQDSLSCINYGYPYRAHPCNECHLLDFVSPEHPCAGVARVADDRSGRRGCPRSRLTRSRARWNRRRVLPCAFHGGAR